MVCMENFILFDKNIGETTSDCIDRLRLSNPEITDCKIGHLGTLDPMASGLMIFLVGDETKKFTQMQKLDKTYTFTIVFGIETDSYDMLGIAKQYNVLGSTYKGKDNFSTHSADAQGRLSSKDIMNVIETFRGKVWQKPPPYSAIRISGKPLYWWYRNNRQDEIKILPREREIFSIDLKRFYDFKLSDLNIYLEIIKNVKGDFRQEIIIEKWKEILQNNTTLAAADLEVQCSSGTYIRALTHDIGEKLGIPCFALNIRRIAIGDFKL